jgi:hypothetical protein
MNGSFLEIAVIISVIILWLSSWPSVVYVRSNDLKWHYIRSFEVFAVM